MTTSKLLLASLFGALIGCVANQALQTTPATAQAGEFTECVAYRLDADSDLEDLPDNAKPIAGWTPVGGAGSSGRLAVVLCR